MIAYKGFEKNLSCRGYQFKRYGLSCSLSELEEL